jgi:hypothetical protein
VITWDAAVRLSCAARPEGQHEERIVSVSLEALDELHALLHRRLAVEHEAVPAEEPGEVL